MTISSELRLLALLSLPQLNSDEKAKISKLLPNSNHEQLLQLVKWNRTSPCVYSNIKNYFTNSFKTTHLEELKTLYAKNVVQCQQQMITIEQIKKSLNHEGIKFRVIKGIPLAHKLYGSPFSRYARDIDIAITPHDLDATLAAFNALGYESRYSTLDKERQTIYLNTQKDITFRDQSKQTIELHYRICEYPCKLSDAILQKLMLDQRNQDKEKYEFIYYCWHGSHTMYHRLKWLVDVAQFCKIHKWSTEDWRNTLTIAQMLGVERCVLVTLALLEKLYDWPAPGFLRKHLKFTLSTYIAYRLSIHFLSNPRFSESTIGKFFAHTTEIFLFSDIREKLRIFIHKFKPSILDISMLPNFPKPLYFLYPTCRIARFFFCQAFLGPKDLSRLHYTEKQKH